MLKIPIFFVAFILTFALEKPCFTADQGRQTISLNGTWEFEAGSETVPKSFTGTVPVPGLVDLATPKISFENYPCFWYRKVIGLSKYKKSDKVFLRFDLSKYGTETWFNGNYLGVYHGCYTSFEFDVTDYINWGGRNEVVVKLGQRSQVVDKSAVGHDGEMKYNIPGIWGDVSLILTGGIYMKNVQALSDINKNEIEVNIWYRNYSGLKEAKVKIRAEELSSNSHLSLRAIAGSEAISPKRKRLLRPATENGETRNDVIGQPHVENDVAEKLLVACEKDVALDENEIINIKMPIKDYKLWSPDTPFLYKMYATLLSDNKIIDNVEVTFGIREFKIKDRHFYLNGKQIFLRGSNIAFHRFLSDPQRSNLPWDEDWIKKCLIDIPKECNMNIFRMHIGHVYNKWYDIADKYGMMIQDEWAFFGITGTKEAMDQEYTQWVMDNWNHPSIVIWDPMNEVRHPYIENVIIPKLKKLDPSRPWEVADFHEEHCYIYSDGPVLHKTQCGPCPPIPELLASKTPIMINEYLWFWLDDKGAPTFFCRPAVERWIGKNTANEENLEYQAFLAKELTELWRRFRIDAIMPFVYLSINNAYTSNYFLGDIKDLRSKPLLKSLEEAFSPFGVSIELWDRHFFTGEERQVSVYVFNDLPAVKKGELLFQVIDARTGGVVQEEKLRPSQSSPEPSLRARSAKQSKDEIASSFFDKLGTPRNDFFNGLKLEIAVEPSSFLKKEITVKFPKKEGDYVLKASLFKDGKLVTTSEKLAYVFEPPKAPGTLKGAKIKIWSRSDEIAAYLKSAGIDAVKYDFDLKDKFVLVANGAILSSEEYKKSIPELTNFVRNGGTLLVIEPSYGASQDKESKIEIVEDLRLLMRWETGIWAKGYDSFIHPDENNIGHPIWAGLKKEHLRMFNGAWGGEVVSECDILFPEGGGRVLSRHGQELKSANTIAFEYGKGTVVVSNLQFRDRLFNNKPDRYSLYNRRDDPVLQKIFLNLLNAYRNPEEIKIRMQTDKVSVYKIFKEKTINAILKGQEAELDGDLKDWRIPTPILMNKNNSLESGEIKDDDDLSAEIYFMWDNENLYFAADIKDDVIIQNKENENIWQDDCIELFIDPQGNGFRWGNPEDLQIGLAPDTKQPSSDPRVWEWLKKDPKVYKSIKGKYKLTEKGYIVEAAIPWKTMGLEAKNALRFNLSVAIHDRDSDAAYARTSKLNYCFWENGDKVVLGVIELKNNP